MTAGGLLSRALSHPRVSGDARRTAEDLGRGRIAIFDPAAGLEVFADLYDVSAWDIAGVFVQRVEDLGRQVLGHEVRPLTDLAGHSVDTLLAACFDASPRLDAVLPFVRPGTRITSFDALRLPAELQTLGSGYLAPLNFATSTALFRSGDDEHTRLTTANHWFHYGARDVSLWLWLFDGDGNRLAEWCEPLPNSPARICLDSREIRARFDLAPFEGTLFLHAVGIAGHDQIKFSLDLEGPGGLSCAREAASGERRDWSLLPAPRRGPRGDERVHVWIHNPTPRALRVDEILLSELGGDRSGALLSSPIPGFGTRRAEVGNVLPELHWPSELAIRSERPLPTPRYEVVCADGRRHVAHAEGRRDDLAADAGLAALPAAIDRGFVAVAPVLPPDEWQTLIRATSLSTSPLPLPLALYVHDASGRLVLEVSLGVVAVGAAPFVDVGELLAREGVGFESGFGHCELGYDFQHGGSADGSLAGSFHYAHRELGCRADVTALCHLYNTPLTYADEPESYTGSPPGLTTRLFQRLGDTGRELEGLLVYPASGAWRAKSTTTISLRDATGRETAQREVHVPVRGSLRWRFSELFDETERKRAAEGYAVIRDTTCRLVGFEILRSPAGIGVGPLSGF